MKSEEPVKKKESAADSSPQPQNGSSFLSSLSGRPGTTEVGLFITCIMGLILSIFYYKIFPIPLIKGTYVYDVFVNRGDIPYAIIFFFFWTATIFILKGIKIWQQKSVFKMEIIPADITTINLKNVDHIKNNMIQLVKNPRHRIVTNRIWTALEHYRSVEMEENVGDILRYQAEIDAGTMDSSYNIAKTFIWAIPILGFIGTVLGIGSAVGGFSKFTQAAMEIDQIKGALDVITAGLSVAFDTTLAGLVCSMILMLPSTALQNSEEKFLTDVETYCIENLLNKLERKKDSPAETAAISSDSAAAKFKRIIEETFQHHLDMLKESFSAWCGGFGEVMDQVTGQTRLVGKEFSAIKDLTSTFKQNMDGFTASLNNIAGQQTEIMGELKEQLRNVQPLVSGMKDISESMAQERVLFHEQANLWTENLEKLENNILLKFEDQFRKQASSLDDIEESLRNQRSEFHEQVGQWIGNMDKMGSALLTKFGDHFQQQLTSLDKIGKDLQTQRSDFNEKLSEWTNGFGELSQQTSYKFEQQLNKMSQISEVFDRMMEKENKIMEHLNQNIAQLDSSGTNLKDVLSNLTDVLTQEEKIIGLVNRNFEQLALSDTMFKDTLAGINNGLESLRPSLEKLAKPKRVQLIEE
jgi:biopolymer transport protein ExbB/TolQ